MNNLQNISLDQAFDPKKNSLNFLRLFLACLVIFSHSYEIGGYGIDPLKTFSQQITIGNIAVNGFFSISGFLITGSFLNSSSMWQYLWKRILRIFPGFLMCLIFTGLILCPFIYFIQYRNFSNVQYLFDNPFINYVKRNLLLRITQPNIDNLFQNHPSQSVINGSLWTLFPEFLCYLFTILIGKLGLLSNTKIKSLLNPLLIIFFVLLFINAYQETILILLKNVSFYGQIWYVLKSLNLLTYFMSGTLVYLYKDIIPFSGKIFWVVIFISIIAMITGIYSFIFPILLPYIFLYLGIVLPFYKLSEYGDYSYGLYVYSYPIQQTTYFFNSNISNVLIFFILSLAVTLPFAYLSWHLIEKPSLKLKNIISI